LPPPLPMTCTAFAVSITAPCSRCWPEPPKLFSPG
jgi:hypothetical protein